MIDESGLVLGLDVGTSGVRIVAVAADGTVLAEASSPHVTDRPAVGAVEQDPETWWTGILACFARLGDRVALGRVGAIAVSSTSGSVCLLDADCDPVRPALLYSDGRARDEARELSQMEPLERPVNATDALAKQLWVRRHEPGIWARIAAVRSPVGFVGARLAGRLLPFDHTQATKFGYDPVAMAWPQERLDLIGLVSTAQMIVVEPATSIGTVTTSMAEATGVRTGTAIVAGATDGVAGYLACRPRMHQGCTILGTTVVWKSMVAEHVPDEDGIYSHRGMRGSWLPGAASNSGGGIIEAMFPGADVAALDVDLSLPSGALLYPLPGRGERFPFRDADAVAFRDLPDETDDRKLFAACLEGVAYVERWGYERLEARGLVDRGLGMVSAGGATRSSTWLRIRASVLGTTISVPADASSAYGAALLAAGTIDHDGPLDAAAAMVRFSTTVEPVEGWVDAYEDGYQRFRDAARSRGWM